MCWEHEGNRAIRKGNFKLVAAGRESEWELYNMAEDRTELNDLNNTYPKETRKLAKLWESWAKKNNVKPYPAP
jgi:arylsulfatase